MRIVSRLTVFSFLVFLFGCDVSQFDPKPHRDRYEKERIISEIKRVQLTDDGQLPAPVAPPETPTSTPSEDTNKKK